MKADMLQFIGTSHEPEANFVIDKFLHGYHTLQYMERGSIALAYAGREQTLSGGWFWTAYPETHIRFHVAPGFPHWFHRHVGFRGVLVQEWISSGLWLTGAQAAPPQTDWASRFDALIADAKRSDRWGNLRATNLLEGLLIELAEARSQAEPRSEPWLQPALDALQNDAAFVPDYDAVAHAAHMAQSTFRRRFKEATGTSPQEFVLQTRLARARALLSDTDTPIKTIADRLGYDTVAFFARQFKERAGVPPGAFRRVRRG